MRLSVTKSKNSTSFFVIRSIYKGGKRTSEVVERLGTEKYIKETYSCEDAHEWAKAYVEQLNKNEKERIHKVLVPYYTDKRIDLNEQHSFNIGYLFLKQIYHKLNIPHICRKISEKRNFTYDLNEILAYLIYGRIMFPSSKLSCFEQSKELFENPNFELQHIYRALEVIAEESDFIQSQLYLNSCKVLKRSTGVLYYDCTNFFFETEHQEGLKQYGISKEHRPNPIVQMGLFMDKSGIPLAFCVNPGNQNEQLSLTPLEKTIMQDFQLSKFVVCTDAGLASNANRKFNNWGERAFITTQSIKTLKSSLKKWALSPEGWHLNGSDKTYDISEIDDTPENLDKIFYKSKYIEGYDDDRDIEFNQNMIVTFSLKYKKYQESIRNEQIERANKAIESNSEKIDKCKATDYRRFISKKKITSNGEMATQTVYTIDDKVIEKEAQYDGFYAVCTNLDDEPEEIVKINHNRWEIEESFRIMKTEFKSRPVYLKRDDRIKAHFMTCFMALLIFRILEKQLKEHYSSREIIECLKGMNITKADESSYIPAYTRTELTDALHENAGFITDYCLLTKSLLKKICKQTEKKK